MEEDMTCRAVEISVWVFMEPCLVTGVLQKRLLLSAVHSDEGRGIDGRNAETGGNLGVDDTGGTAWGRVIH
jgi:hypothetical protein